MSTLVRPFVLFGSILVAVACLVGFTGCLGNLGEHPPGSGTGSNPGTGGGTGSGGSGTLPTGTCGQQTFPLNASKLVPNVLMVVDESGSMKQLIPNSTQSKWDALKSAVNDLLTTYDGAARWGLSIFPKPNAGDTCAAGAIEIPIAKGTEPQILARLAMLTNSNIGGNTPTETTLQAAEASGLLNDPQYANYVLLMTDGLPTCNQDGRVTPVISDLYKRTPSVRTFVVGIGQDTQSNPTELDQWAEAGGTARTNAPHKYYQANDAADLQKAFGEIVSGIASCTYQLASAPPDPTLLIPYLDGTAIARDATNGFTYDATNMTLTFHGTSCDSLKSGSIAKVDIVYGCAAQIN